MTFAERFAAEAREWVGTPFVWGQAVKGVGCDCKGLLLGVTRELGRREADSFYATFSGYRADRPVPGELLVEGFSNLFKPADDLRAGCILLLKYRGGPGHMAIAVEKDRAVHAHPGSGVKERDLSILFHKYPLHSIWRFKCR